MARCPRSVANGEVGDPVLDRVFDVLAHPVRRQVLYHLQDEAVMTIEDAATRVAAASARDADLEVDQIMTMLHHSHLPRLAEAGVIEYDQRSDTIRRTEPPDALTAFLDLAREYEDAGR